MLVMEEAFDCWEQGKNPDDYHNYFDEWWERDLEAMVLRDRSRPSIVMWSIGNEIPMRTTAAGYVVFDFKDDSLCNKINRIQIQSEQSVG